MYQSAFNLRKEKSKEGEHMRGEVALIGGINEHFFRWKPILHV